MTTPDLTKLCITDVGSTTTKAILFRKTEGGAWEFFRRERPTTVEKPYEDVSIGVTAALRALEEETGETLLRDGAPAVPYLSTSSAGGGLAMVVTGLVKELTAQTADRVALGAGAIVLDVVCMNDGRTAYRQIEDLKRLRPDMVLLAGGYDGEAISAPVFLAELLVESELHPKLNPDAKLPVVYGGNVNARPYVEQSLGNGFLFHPVPNVRPTEERENTRPARRAIHEIFMNHVMSMAPGYDKLTPWVAAPISPTPAAFADLLALVSRDLDKAILAIDVGGATTDVFSAWNGEVVRTVSANIGMSYSVLNVARLGGTAPISAFLDIEIGEEELWNRIGNKHVHPTTLPATLEDAKVEWATATVAIREAVREHLEVMRGLPERELPAPFDVNAMLREDPKWPGLAGSLRTLDYDLVIGSGGILSHSPREAAATMLMDAVSPPDPTEIAVDRAFMFPHLGVLSHIEPELAKKLFFDLALVRLGTVGELRAKTDGAAAGFEPPGGGARTEAPAQIRTGRIAARRDLAIEGDVLVAPGDAVESDTVVARAVRQFLRPFFLNVARVMQIDPTEVWDVLIKGVGDDVGRQEIIAKQRMRLGVPSSYRSPVEGRIEKILPDGTVVVRENPERAQVLTTVEVAKDLGVYPDKLKPYLKVKVGDEVERGQWLAAIVGGGSLQASESPVRGKVSRIDKHFGMVMIEPLLEELEVEAWLPGTVESVSERGCVVVAEATEITGVWGSGGETRGPLSIGNVTPGSVVVLDSVGAEAIARCREAGVAGVIAGGVNLRDALDPDLGFTLVATGDFGTTAIAPEIRDVLADSEGRLTLMDGTTQLRVGVRRPRIVLPQ
ncbi:MAG: glutamate mutase L [Candidatus Eisenbacteria bacterium]|nr:glutamate mutase L [Candidatus Eisenbacteria bacterium]